MAIEHDGGGNVWTSEKAMRLVRATEPPLYVCSACGVSWDNPTCDCRCTSGAAYQHATNATVRKLAEEVREGRRASKARPGHGEP